MKYEAIKIGDKVPHEPPQEMIQNGHPRWFGILVKSESESKARAWVDQFIPGATAFFPVEKATRQARGRTGRVEYERRYLPGYVFVQFPGEPIWHRLFEVCPFIRDVIRYNSGHPAPLDPASLRRLYEMRSVDAERKARDRMARTIRKGDRVAFDVAGVAYSDVEVIDITGPFGTVRLKLLGKDAIQVPLTGMKKISCDTGD